MNTTPESPELPKSLVARLRVFKDTRIDRTRHHELIDVLVIVLCTILCGVKVSMKWKILDMPKWIGFKRSSNYPTAFPGVPIGILADLFLGQASHMLGHGCHCMLCQQIFEYQYIVVILAFFWFG